MPPNVRLPILLFALAFIGLGIVSKTLTMSAQNSPTTQQEQSEPLPKGRWKVGTIFDSKQYADPSVPVEFTRVTLANKEESSGLVELFIKNRTSKNISALKIRYFLTSWDNAETILYQGPALEVISKRVREKPTLPASQKRIFDVKDGKFRKLLKPLVKDGTLNGNFIITLRISEVVFEDGTVWKEEETVSYGHKPLIHSAQTSCP